MLYLSKPQLDCLIGLCELELTGLNYIDSKSTEHVDEQIQFLTEIQNLLIDYKINMDIEEHSVSIDNIQQEFDALHAEISELRARVDSIEEDLNSDLH